MAGEVSFDVVSDFDVQELRNALDQVRREVGQRYDFRQSTVDLEQGKDELTLVTDDEYRAAAVKDLIESKAIRRGLSLKVFDWGKVFIMIVPALVLGPMLMVVLLPDIVLSHLELVPPPPVKVEAEKPAH